MSDSTDRSNILAKVWTALSIAQRIELGLFSFSTLALAMGLGYWIKGEWTGAYAHQHSPPDKTTVPTTLEGRAPPPTVPFAVLDPPQSGLPSYDEAAVSALNMEEFYTLLGRHVENHNSESKDQGAAFYSEFAGKKFTWRGYVVSVNEAGFGHIPYPVVYFSPHREADNTTTCKAYFIGGCVRELVKSLSPGQAVTIRGVLNDRGQLTYCHFIRIEN